MEVLGAAEHSEADGQTIVRFVEAHGGLEAASDTARQYARRARGCLAVLQPSPYREALETAVKVVVERDS